ncbi:hypothetical protein [Streptomyces sp. 11x1]|uniref:VOC family protein n=1 Tax=Streptomyces sp. 11x1 TaxID=3038642 RepID=UPI00292E0D72|nr:hypothetical protein [Streptomyces sp. 11x1]WNZ12053.1 hypothetical protein P8T65_33835 [Streptomyces sp. 11x1]
MVCDGPPSERDALLKVIALSWRRYRKLDAGGYLELFDPDHVRASSRLGRPQRGSKAVSAALPREWEAYERVDGAISARFTPRRVELWVDETGDHATALYWLEVASTNARWSYDDQGLVLQTFKKHRGMWRIAHHTDVWDLNYDLERQKPGQDVFSFDFVYPVRDLGRAVRFYTPLLGAPFHVGDDSARFQMPGGQFVLDADRLGGRARLAAGLPNGWGVTYVGDVAAERDRLARRGVRFVDGTDAELLKKGPDRYAIGLDSSSANPFVLAQRHYATDGPAPGELSGFTETGAAAAMAKRIAKAWLHTDAHTLGTLYGRNGRWLDSTRTAVRGLEDGQELPHTLDAYYWRSYDRSPRGLSAELHADNLHVQRAGRRSVVTHTMRLTGTGPQPFRDTALVTHLLDADNRPLITIIAPATADENSQAMARQLDYTGYPVTSLKAAERFYRKTLDWGSPYQDDGWRGWWSRTESVFGIYTADPDQDGLPRSGVPSGYVSFWVHSARRTYEWMRSEGSRFPEIPSINEGKAGISRFPGYTQVVGTDSEGNLLVLTEYTGK